MGSWLCRKPWRDFVLDVIVGYLQEAMTVQASGKAPSRASSETRGASQSHWGYNERTNRFAACANAATVQGSAEA